MLSFNSLIFTIFAIIAIWKGFALLQRFSNQQQGPSAPSKRPERGEPPAPDSIELKPCPRCGAYVDPKQGCKCSSSSA